MVSRLDQNVGHTITALTHKGMLNNAIVLLYSDNGAPTVGLHSNHPFKGQKRSPWEGGIRSAGLIWSPVLQQKNYVSNQVTHAIDWLPTLASAAGIKLPKDLRVDGVDLWSSLSQAEDPQPRRLLHVLDDIFGYSAYTRGNLKYVNGTSWEGQYDTWLGDIADQEVDPLANFYVQEVLSSEVHTALGDQRLSIELINRLRTEATHSCPLNSENYEEAVYNCEPLKAPRFFNIDKDPCERYNLANLYPLQDQFLAQELDEYRVSAKPSVRVPWPDPLSDPKRNWQWWKDTEDKTSGTSTSSKALGWTIFLSLIVNYLQF